MRYFAIYFLLSSALLFGTKAESFDHSHSAWSDELDRYLDKKTGLVDYKQWHGTYKIEKKGVLADYLTSLSAIPIRTFESWTVNQQKAFLVNAYNSLTIKLILDHFPVKSIKKIGGFLTKPWDIDFFKILDGKITSLDSIEHEYLRKIPKYKDPRIHAAVNCASISCPRLWHEAFVASKLDQQLDDAARTWLRDSTRNRYDLKTQKIEISKIFDWFEEDFGNSSKGVIAFIKAYGPEEIAKKLSDQADISYLDYNWQLNIKS